MQGSERLILLGTVIAVIGVLIIAISTSSDGSGFFFVFPFFVFGDIPGSFIIAIMACIALMFVIFFILPASKGLSQGWNDFNQNDVRKYVRIFSQCEFCNKPIPDGSVFCPSCGSPIREDSSDRYESMN